MGDKSPKREIKAPKRSVKDKRRERLEKKAAKSDSIKTHQLNMRRLNNEYKT